MNAVQEQVIPGFNERVVRPDAADFDTLCAVWNVMHDRRPAVIAGCESPQDVAAAIAHGREHGLAIAVRGGGHSLPGFSSIDQGIVIDLRAINDVVVDPAAHRVRVGGGALLGNVDRGAQAHDLVVRAGVVSPTGIGWPTSSPSCRYSRRFTRSTRHLTSSKPASGRSPPRSSRSGIAPARSRSGTSFVM